LPGSEVDFLIWILFICDYSGESRWIRSEDTDAQRVKDDNVPIQRGMGIDRITMIEAITDKIIDMTDVVETDVHDVDSGHFYWQSFWQQ
jgi:hypothetical protein